MRRLIHYTLKVSDREVSKDFFVNTLGMRVLRHEEYDDGCKVECNGSFKNPWSKTLVGYDRENKHFVLELVYNYNVDKYDRGNDFMGIFIQSTDLYMRCTKNLVGEVKVIEDVSYLRVLDPDGHAFYIKKGANRPEQIFKIGLNTKHLDKTIDYWTNVLGMKKMSSLEHRCIVGYAEEQCCLEWHQLSELLVRGNGYGRVAFSIPTNELKQLEIEIKFRNLQVLFPLQQLGSGDTRESVLILADPNDHEICFVGESEFLKLSEEDVEASDKLSHAIENERREQVAKN